MSRAKKKFFKTMRLLPPVRRRIENEIAKVTADMEKSTHERIAHMQHFITLPMLGLSKEELLLQIDNYLALSEYKWKDGHVSGAVYNYDTELCYFVGKIYEKTAYTNPLHSDVFPGINKMEAEVVRMCATMFNGDANTVGTVREIFCLAMCEIVYMTLPFMLLCFFVWFSPLFSDQHIHIHLFR